MICKSKVEFGLVCGHPLPCPDHTVVLDNGKVYQPKKRILVRRQYFRLKTIAAILEQEDAKN